MRRLSHIIRRIWPRRVRVTPVRASETVPHEAIFAAAFGELLACGLPAATALADASEVVTGRRVHSALQQMIGNFRSGYCLEVSLRKTGFPVDPGLLAALATGEEIGPLADEMLAYARSAAGDERALHRALGRTAAAAVFAATLSRLLAERPLTPEIVVAAGRVAVGRYPEFTPAVLRGIHDRLMAGEALADAIRRETRIFDPLFIRCVAACQTRPALQAVLERLGRTA